MSGPQPPSPPACSSSLHRLPNELLDHVLSFLSIAPPPSTLQRLRQVPGHSITTAADAPLKSFSRVDSRCRAICLAQLFRHTRYELRDQANFLAFLRRHDHELCKHVRSVVVSVRSIFRGSEKPLWWRDLLDMRECGLDPDIVTVVAPPYMFADMAQCTLKDVHDWVFQLPLQIMQFRQPVPRPADFTKPEGDDTFFSARPWTELLFNEGSSLRAYSHYEYYLLRVPSLMDHWGSVDPLQTTEFPYPLGAISRLTVFHYTAIFPFYNHTNLVLKVVRNMSNLRHLSIQLAPDAHSTIFEEERETGTLDPNDPWMELETSYSLIAHSVRYLGVQKQLVEFRTYDYELDALKENLVAKLSSGLKGKWTHDGNGLWIKKPPPKAAAQENDDA
jgi:hypothetical protein